MRIYIKTFGCRVNQYETEILREQLLAGGAAAAVKAWEKADICVVNTCTVTQEADEDALRLVRRIARRNPAARLVVTGCLASRAPEKIREAAPAALIAGNEAKQALAARLGRGAAPDSAGITGFHERSRALVKAQDGCNMACAYCIVPSVRPRMVCKPCGEIEREVLGLVERGIREIVVCGVRLGRYLADDGSGRRVDFVAMLERLLSLPGDFRVRLSSLEVTDLTDRLLDLLARREGRLCPSFHVPLQSGSDPVLKRMHRWYTAAFYKDRVSALRRLHPESALFADVMAGFPGETAEEFEESFRFVSGLDFCGLHVFRYSRRPGTPAARYKGQVPEEEVMKRSSRLRELDLALRRDFARRAVGRTHRVLVERRGSGKAEGVTGHFLRVRFDCDPGPGLVWARVIAADGIRGVAQPV